jgi:hypothetical protein
VYPVPSEWEARKISNITPKRQIYLIKCKIYNLVSYKSDEFKTSLKTNNYSKKRLTKNININYQNYSHFIPKNFNFQS